MRKVLEWKVLLIIADGQTGIASPNCIRENVTMRRNVASGKMLLSDRQKSQSEEQHDEPEKQARVVRSSTATLSESEQTGKTENAG
jgi:hypothetical protein